MFYYDEANLPPHCASVRAYATNMVNENPQMHEALTSIQLKVSALTALARSKDTKTIDRHNLLAQISQDDSQYQ